MCDLVKQDSGLTATARTLLSRHKARKRAHQQMSVAETFWATRLKFCLDWIKSGETPERMSDLEQAVRVYQRATGESHAAL